MTESKAQYDKLPNQEQLDEIRKQRRMVKKSMIMKSFIDSKDQRVNCGMEQSEFMEKQRLESKRAMTKLLVVTLISFIFMLSEFVGGYLSGSLAIMTDAAHMLSDVAGYLISFFAIYLASRPANNQMSFGYHRAEILGALASILLIWGLIVWLFTEAIHRCVHPEDIDGPIMLITACVGLVCNLISIFLLHSCGGSHGHHHHGHSHEEDLENGHRLSHCHQPMLEQISQSHHNSMHKKAPEIQIGAEKSETRIFSYDDAEEKPRFGPVNHSELSPNTNSNIETTSELLNKDSSQFVLSEENKKEHHHEHHGHDHNHDHHHDHKHDKKKGKRHTKKPASHGHEHDHHHHGVGGHHGHSHENMNIRAAIIHIIGDIIQSVGVVIAAVIIYFRPDLHIVDPICTFIFTFLCVFTTIPIFKDIVQVLMEATPKNVDVIQCFQDVLEIEEVEEIHDFHVWSLSVGKLSMSAHIRSVDHHIALQKMTKLLREKYQIFHTTIQVEKYDPDTEIGCCDNDHTDHNHHKHHHHEHEHHDHDHNHDHKHDHKKEKKKDKKGQKKVHSHDHHDHHEHEEHEQH